MSGTVLVWVAMSAVAGLVSWFGSGWPAVGLGAAALVWVFKFWLRANRERAVYFKTTEAISTWVDMVKDSLSGGAGLSQAIEATVPVAPDIVRPHVVRLAGSQRTSSQAAALRQFAEDLAHPTSDLVVQALITASEHQGRDLPKLLAKTSEQARARNASVLQTESERAQLYTEAWIMVLAISLLGVVITLIARDFFKPYDTTFGQLVLTGLMAIVGGIDRLADPRRATAEGTPAAGHSGPAATRRPAMILIAVLFVSAVLGTGLMLAYRAFTLPATTLDNALERSRHTWQDAPESLFERIVRQVEAIGTTVPASDLEVLNWTEYEWHRRRLFFVIGSALFGALVTVVARLYVAFPVLLALPLIMAIFGALGLALVESDRTTKAAAARNEIRAALTQFLELTSIMLAGGAGAETALERASLNGYGRGFSLFAREIVRAKEDPKLNAFVALRDLGMRINISELVDFGNVMILSSENSATIRQALNDKAGLIVLQDHERRRAAANSRNVWMSIPVVGMAGGFIFWLMYAATASLVGVG